MLFRSILFFNSIYDGDSGTTWEPSFTGLTTTGTPTITGKYFRISGKLIYFNVVITPATNTSSVAGTTYINNFPLTIAADGACHAVAGNTGSTAGMAVASTNRIYTPDWTLVTNPVTVTGFLEAA